MAQVIETYCDGCLEHGERTQGRTYRTAIGIVGTKHPTYDIDLCDDCAKPLSVLLEGLADKGRVVGGKRGRPKGPTVLPSTPPAATGAAASSVNADLTCPLSGCDYVSSTSAAAVRSHLRTVHDTTWAEATGQELPYVCDVCAKKFANAQGVGAHRARSHPDAPSVSVSELRVDREEGP